MDFGLTETQEMIRSSAREFLADRADPLVVRAVADGDSEALESLWKDIVELGWPALTIPVKYGGAGLTFSDLAVLLEEMGASLAPSPLVESAITSRILDRYGSDAVASDLLPQVAAGDVLITPAILERDVSWDSINIAVAATRTGSGFVITGEKRFVSYADQATHALILVRMSDDDPALIVVPIWKVAGVDLIRLDHISGVPVSSISFNEVEAPLSAVVATGDKAIAATEELVAAGATARAAQLAGLGRAVVDSTIEYTRNREQFGQPVGSFQAIQHHIAEMAIAAKQVNHLAQSAAWTFSDNSFSADRAAQAKIAASDKIPALCWTAHQCHGAIGFTKEHDLHLYTRRALAWKMDYGSPAFHKDKLASSMGL